MRPSENESEGSEGGSPKKKTAREEFELGSEEEEEVPPRKRTRKTRKSGGESGDAPQKKKARKDPTGGKWGKMFAKLEAYRAEKGDCNVPKNYPEDKKLGSWVNTNRTKYKKWKKTEKDGDMTLERAQKLEGIGFVWDPHGEQWDANFAKLEEYRAEKGDCNVPKRYTEDKQLGTWVINQRQQYKLRNEGKRSSLNEDRVQKLEGIGFVWDPFGEQWNNSFQLLQAYKAKEGHCYVPRGYEDEQFGRWVETQRQQYRLRNEGKPSQMTDERVASLNSIDFDWVYRHPAYRRDVAIMQQFT